MRRTSKLLKLTALCLILSLAAGCAGTQTGEGELPQQAADEPGTVRQEEESIADWKLRDNSAVYELDDPYSVVTMYLTVRKGNAAEGTDHTWEEVNTHSAYYYDELGIDRYQVAAILQVGDESGPLPGEFGYGENVPNAVVQIRGQTSSRNAQKSFKISIKDGKGTWREQKTIALNKHMTDGLRFRNKLCYDLMQEIPQMMSARTQFVHLYVKDETASGNGEFVDYGLFTQVEQINKTYLRSHGLDRNGQLYKINFFEYQRYEDVIRLSTDPEYDITAFEEQLEIKGDDDHTKLIAMLDAVNDYTVPIEEVVEEYFDAENLCYWMAFHILAGNTDTEARNYYLYSPLNSEKFYVISWDNDVAFKREEYRLSGRIEGGAWQRGLSNYWGNILYQRMFKVQAYRDMLDEAINDLRENYLTEEKIAGMAEAYAEVVKPYVYSMPDIVYAPLTEEEYDQIAEGIACEVEENYGYYLESLEKPMPFYIGTPTVSGDDMTFVWDVSYDFDGEAVAYTFELDDDYLFEDTIYKEEGLRYPSVILDTLPAGQYFIRVTAQNESGYSQTAFDYYVTDIGKHYGVKCFYVLEDGTVEEDVYEE